MEGRHWLVINHKEHREYKEGLGGGKLLGINHKGHKEHKEELWGGIGPMCLIGLI